MSTEWAHDWSGGVTETLQWRTRVSRSRGETRPNAVQIPVTETRVRLAPAPHRQWTSRHWSGERTDLRTFGAPEYIVGYRPGSIAARVTSSADTVLVEHAWAYGFEIGGYLMVVRADGTTDTREITQLVGGWITLSSGVSRTAGDLLMPAFWARRSPSIGIQWQQPEVRIVEDTWTATEPATIILPQVEPDQGAQWWTPIQGGETYEVIPWRGADSQSAELAEQRVTAVGGAWSAREIHTGVVDRVERTRQVYGLVERARLRALLYRREGRLNPAWVPAGQRLPLLGLRSHAGGVYAAFPAAWLDGLTRPETRAAIVLWGVDGSATPVSAQIWADSSHATLPVPADEVWIAGRVDPAPSVAIESADWLLWARLDSDAVTIHHVTPEASRVTLGWVTLPQVPYIGVPGPAPPPIQAFASGTLSIVGTATATVIAEDYLDGAMVAQAALTIGRLRLELAPLDVNVDGAMVAQAALTIGRLRLELADDPVAKILATNPAHFWWFGGLTYGGVETMRDDQGDPIVDDSTDVYAVRDLVTDSWDMEDWSSSGGIRFADHRLTGGVEGLAIEGLSIADASWVTVIRRTTSSPLNTNLLLEAEQATGDVYSADVVGTVIQGVDGSSSSRTGATFGAETAYYRYRSGSDRKALAMDGDDSEWAVSGTGAAAWGGVYLRGDNGLLADALCIIVYDHGERVKELLDEGLHQLIIDLQEYEP